MVICLDVQAMIDVFLVVLDMFLAMPLPWR